MTNEESLKQLDFIEKLLEKLESQISTSLYSNLSLFYGLLFGIIGNLLVSAFFDYHNKETNLVFWIIIFCLGIICLLCILFITENKKSIRHKSEINNYLLEITKDREDLEKGIWIPDKNEVFKKYTHKITNRII